MPNALAEPANLGPTRARVDLVDRLVTHDESAFDELVRTYRPRMMAVASRYLPRADDAEDAVQEAFVNVVRSIAGFKRESSLETWIHRVVVNCALMSLRHRRRLHETTMNATTPDGDVCGRCRKDTPPRQARLSRATSCGRRSAASWDDCRRRSGSSSCSTTSTGSS